MAKSTLLISMVAALCMAACEPDEPDPVPVDGGVQHPVRDAGTRPPEAGASEGGSADAGNADAGSSDAGSTDAGGTDAN
jgi:hypothetical protein